MSVLTSFQSISRPALKYESYIDTYEIILSKYKGQKVTFVEVGVLGGGSLQAWKNFFHPESRIIGIDLNHSLKAELESEGFEIFIGNQSDYDFWDNFYSKVGNIDILLDDGGHTNLQQGVTLIKTIPMVNDNGVIIIEDVHTSYMEKFLNPSKYSFINFTKYFIDVINDRFYSLNKIKSMDVVKYNVQYISVFESIIAFHIDKSKCYISVEKRFGKESDEYLLPIDIREDGHKINFFNKMSKMIIPLFSQNVKKSGIGKFFKYLFYFDFSQLKENNKMKSLFKK